MYALLVNLHPNTNKKYVLWNAASVLLPHCSVDIELISHGQFAIGGQRSFGPQILSCTVSDV